jgi:hypothetical protein
MHAHFANVPLSDADISLDVPLSVFSLGVPLSLVALDLPLSLVVGRAALARRWTCRSRSSLDMPPSDANVSLDASHSVFLCVDASTRDAHDHVHAHLANVPLSDADISLDVPLSVFVNVFSLGVPLSLVALDLQLSLVAGRATPDFGAYPNPGASARMTSLICSGVVRYGYEVGADVVCCINLEGGGCNYGGHPVNTDSQFLADNPTALQQFWSHMVSSQNGYELDPTAARRLGIHYNALSPAFKSCNPDLPTISGEAKIQPTAAELAEVDNNANSRGRSRSRGRTRDRAPPSGVSFQTAPSAAAAVAPVLAPAVVNAVASPMTAPQNAVPVPVSEPDAFAGQATEILMCELGGVLETKFTPTRAAECMGKIEAGLVKDPVAQRACVIAMLRRFES